jgi:glycerol-3-phosphate dehydrogenase (NAD(P)+)
MLWGRRPQAMADMAFSHVNAEYLPGITLPANLRYTSDLDTAFGHLTDTTSVGLLLLATPMAGLSQTCELVSNTLTAGLKLAGMVWTCKGLTPEGGKLPHEVVAQALAAHPDLPVGVLSGPSFAKEVARNLPVALTIASADMTLKQQVIDVFHTDHMRIYTSTDVMGVEVGGALKNVMAIACGISDGLGLGDNARAALITRGLAEMTRLGVAMGAEPSTFAGLTGLGDLVLTATGHLSRNRQVGLRIGNGESLEEILADGMTAEGARCAHAVLIRAAAIGVPMPITEAVCDTLFGGVTAADTAHRLMARSATEE